MRVLVACEYSGIVREAFRAAGHDAISCDILPALDDSPNHYQGDVLDILEDGWDMLVGHPPCTHLAVSGARWWKNKQKEQHEAILFFLNLMGEGSVAHGISRVAIENPVGIMSTVYRPPDQYVEPYWFGDSFKKRTGLWLKGLPELVKTNEVDPGRIVVHGGRRIPEWYSNRTRPRDMSFPGMARAMAEQWGRLGDDARVEVLDVTEGFA